MEKLDATVFLKVVETGSFKKAADILGYTQAGISYIINSMEEECGLQLFYREYGGVRLTPEGDALLPYIRDIADREHYLEEAINDVKNLDAGTVRVSTFSSVYIHWLPGIISTFKKDYPNINIEIISYEEDQKNEDMIYNRQVDCGFMASPPVSKAIDFFALMEEPLMVVMSTDHPMATHKTFPRSMIGDYPYIMMTYDKQDFNSLIFTDGIKPQTAFTVDNDYAAMAMASKGLGLCISPQIQLNDMPFPLKYMEFEPTLRRTVGIGTRSLTGCTRAAREFISCARRWVRANV